ncbi:MAG: tRNA pseudouridine(55) synthase TruB [Rikenellaceae bacterium]|nr:tRNA pseudouridine(55) synthase TruB [Rikenellaceae bacterium]
MEKIFPRDTNFAEGCVINVDKPLGWTSTDVVRKIKFLLQRGGHRKLKVGHAGTLDPLATGVLLVCTGKATKMVDTLQAQPKEYLCDMMFGATTPSYDLEHPVDRTYPYDHITRGKLEAALGQLCGERLQTPPLYSAKKIDGQRAYQYAREGTEVEMRKAAITVYGIDLVEFDLPRVRLRIECSKGTYIRSLAMELGELLASGAHLTSLRRTRSGEYTGEDAWTMEQIVKSFHPGETK